jgi:hypothetical protein
MVERFLATGGLPLARRHALVGKLFNRFCVLRQMRARADISTKEADSRFDPETDLGAYLSSERRHLAPLT